MSDYELKEHIVGQVVQHAAASVCGLIMFVLALLATSCPTILKILTGLNMSAHIFFIVFFVIKFLRAKHQIKKKITYHKLREMFTYKGKLVQLLPKNKYVVLTTGKTFESIQQLMKEIDANQGDIK